MSKISGKKMATESFSMDVSEIEKFERETLKKVKAIAFPLAIQGTLNTAAFNSMRKAKKTIKEDFVNRNTFTERSVRVERTRTLKIIDMASTVGSIAPYMLEQEEGAKKTSKGKHGLRIPTGAAAGQSQLFPRRRPVRKPFRRGQTKIANAAGRIQAANRQQFILMSIRVAALRGQPPFVFLSFGKSKKTGLYKVIPRGSPPPTRYKRGKSKFARKFKWGRPRGQPGKEKLVLIHSFGHRSITIPQSRWLGKTTTAVAGTLAIIFKKEADRIFDRFVK
jgi:hypothetical protein